MEPVWCRRGSWTADPNTSYIAFSIAQNINEEWGPLAKKEFTTPEAPASQKKQSAPVMKRKMVKNVYFWQQLCSYGESYKGFEGF